MLTAQFASTHALVRLMNGCNLTAPPWLIPIMADGYETKTNSIVIHVFVAWSYISRITADILARELVSVLHMHAPHMR